MLPTNLEQLTWFLIGFTLARAFGKQCDQTIKSTDWFKRRSKVAKWLIASLLDFLHHFWIGLLLMTYAQQIANAIGISPDAVFWFGYGVLVDDLPDIPRRYRRWFAYLFKGGQQ